MTKGAWRIKYSNAPHACKSKTYEYMLLCHSNAIHTYRFYCIVFRDVFQQCKSKRSPI